MKLIIYLCFLLLSHSVWAKRQLLARASDVDGFPASSMCFFSNHKMAQHKNQLLLKYSCFSAADLQQELWLIGTRSQRIVQSSVGNLLSDPASDGEHIYVVEFNESGSLKLWQNDLSFKIHPAIQFVHDVIALGSEHLLARVTLKTGQMSQWEWHKGQWISRNHRGVSYYFTPGASSQLILQKLRLGEGELSEDRPDVLEVSLAPNFQPQIVARDRDADPQSEFLGFYNFSVVNGDRWVAVARTEAGDVALIGAGTQYVVRSLSEHFKALDFWPMAISADGRVIVRGHTLDGTYGLWMLEQGPRQLLSKGDTITTDLGVGVLGEVLFYNAPMVLNEKILIGVGLTEMGSTTPWGQGVIAVSID